MAASMVGAILEAARRSSQEAVSAGVAAPDGRCSDCKGPVAFPRNRCNECSNKRRRAAMAESLKKLGGKPCDVCGEPMKEMASPAQKRHKGCVKNAPKKLYEAGGRRVRVRTGAELPAVAPKEAVAKESVVKVEAATAPVAEVPSNVVPFVKGAPVQVSRWGQLEDMVTSMTVGEILSGPPSTWKDMFSLAEKIGEERAKASAVRYASEAVAQAQANPCDAS